MARKKKKAVKSLVQCKFCMISFTNLGCHFYNNPLCAEYHLNNDSTLVATDAEIQNTNEVSTQIVNTNTFDYLHTNDINANLFELNDNESCNSNQQINENTSTQDINILATPLASYTNNQTSSINNHPPREILTLSSQYDNLVLHTNSNDSIDNESLNSNTFINSNIANNESYTGTCNQIDTMIETMSPILSITEIINTNRNMISSNVNQSYLYDFTQFRIKVLKQMIYLPVDYGTIASIKLLKIMKDGNMATLHYKKLIEWHLDTMNMTTQSNCQITYPIIKSRQVVIDHLHKLLYQSISDEFNMRPNHRIIMLPSRRTTKISKFDLKTSLASMLTDPVLMQRDNIYLNDKTYINPSAHKSISYKDIHHGSSFLNAYETLCNEPNDVLVPIIPFIDGTPIDPYGRNKLEVVMFTLGLFKQKVRHQTNAWQIAGYIPDPCNENNGQHDFYDMSGKNRKLQKEKIIMKCYDIFLMISLN